MKITHLFAIVTLFGFAAFSTGCASRGMLNDEVARLEAQDANARAREDRIVKELNSLVGDLNELYRAQVTMEKKLLGNDQILASRIEGLESTVAPKPKPQLKSRPKPRVKIRPKPAAPKPDCAESK